MDNIELIKSAPDCEIVSSRIFNWPIDLLFRAWTEPDHLAKWWGPAGFTNSFEEFDPRPGGKWKFTMHGPDKGHYPNEVEFLKVERPHLIAWNRISKPIFKVQATFEEIQPGKTKLVFKMLFETAAECNKLTPFVVDKNEENFDRLEAELFNMSK